MNPLPQYRDPAYLEHIEGTALDLIAVVDGAGRLTIQRDTPAATPIATTKVPTSRTAVVEALGVELAQLGYRRASQWDRRCGAFAVAAVEDTSEDTTSCPT